MGGMITYSIDNDNATDGVTHTLSLTLSSQSAQPFIHYMTQAADQNSNYT